MAMPVNCVAFFETNRGAAGPRESPPIVVDISYENSEIIIQKSTGGRVNIDFWKISLDNVIGVEIGDNQAEFFVRNVTFCSTVFFHFHTPSDFVRFVNSARPDIIRRRISIRTLRRGMDMSNGSSS